MGLCRSSGVIRSLHRNNLELTHPILCELPFYFNVAGNKVFEFRSYCVSRSATPAEEFYVTPDDTLKSLSDLVGFVNS